MKILNKSVRYVLRNINQSGTMFCVILLLNIFFITSNNIVLSTNIGLNLVKGNLEATTIVVITGKNLSMEEFESIEPLTREFVEILANDERVKYYDYSRSHYIVSNDVEKVTYDKMGDEPLFIGFSSTNIFRMKGVQYPPIFDYYSGKIELLEGRVFTDLEIEYGEEKVVISKELAENNNLRIGDTMEMLFETIDYNYMIEYDPMNPKEDVVLGKKNYFLEVIGIYEPNELIPINDNMDDDEKISALFFNETEQNVIYVPNNVVEDVQNFQVNLMEENNIPYQKQGFYSFPIYSLKSVEDINGFENYYENLLPEHYVFHSNTNDYEMMFGTLQKINETSNIIASFSWIVSTFIIVLLYLYIFKVRMEELKVYIALGMRKVELFQQLFIEFIIVSFIAFLFAIILSNFGVNYFILPSIFNNVSVLTEQMNELVLPMLSYKYFIFYGVMIISISAIILHTINSLLKRKNSFFIE